MKIRMVILLLFSLVSFGGPRAALADNQYTAREILRGTVLYRLAAFPNGWLAVVVNRNDNYRTILIGPYGYRRDITSFTRESEEDKSTSVKLISDDGTVYFETDSLNKGVTTEREFSYLSRDSKDVRLIATFPHRGSQLSNASFNSRGELMVVEYDESALNNTVEYRTLGGGLPIKRTLSLPNRIKRGKAAIYTYFDDQGRFLISREQYTKNHRKLVDICSGAVQSDAISCATADQIAKVANRGKGSISGVSEGKVLVDNMGRLNLVDSTTFEVAKSFRFPRYNYIYLPYAVGQDLSMLGLSTSSLTPPSKARMTVVDPFSGSQVYSCDFFPKDSTFVIPWTDSSILTSSHIYIFVPNHSDKIDEYGTILYEISLTETRFPDSPVVGGCSVIQKRTF